MLTLEDLKGMTEAEVLDKLINEYGEGHGNSLTNKEVLVAYESVGSWGCDSSSFFLLKDKITGELYEIHGSHCSCFGFEGQLQLEPTTLEALKYRIKEGDGVFYTGGYDSHSNSNKNAVDEYINNL